MKNVKKLLFAAALIGAAVVSAPRTARATGGIGCGVCASSGGTNCQACCQCDGGTPGYCARFCSGL
jgi:hypothetical protein